MKIVHVITRLIVGGAQQNTLLSCEAQVRAGHEVTLAYGPIYGPEGSLAEWAGRCGARVVVVDSLRRAILPVHDFVCYRALRKLIREIKPDVVHTHSSKAGIVGRAAAWKERVPAVVHTIHGLAFHDRQSAPVHALYVASERWAARRCHKMIGVTQAMCDAFLALHIGRPGQFTMVPSGVDITTFAPPPEGARERVREELGIDSGAPVVGIVARLDKLKGQDDMLDVLPTVAQRIPGVKLVIVGDGWPRKHLEERVGREGLGGRVIFTGLVTPQRVAELLGAMDVSVLPSYQEGQPRTLVQALLCGCGIVGYDAGGVGEICIDGRTGRLVPVGDRAKLAEAILWMLDHPEERQKLAEEGRRYAVERFDHRKMVARLEEIYREVLAGSGGKIK